MNEDEAARVRSVLLPDRSAPQGPWRKFSLTRLKPDQGPVPPAGPTVGCTIDLAICRIIDSRGRTLRRTCVVQRTLPRSALTEATRVVEIEDRCRNARLDRSANASIIRPEEIDLLVGPSV